MPETVAPNVAVALIMLIAGAAGGLANWMTRTAVADLDVEPSEDADENVDHSLLATVLLGIVAAFVVPLFLSLAKSTLFNDVVQGLAGKTDIKGDAFVLFGFCLVAALSARAFMSNVTGAVLNLGRNQRRLKRQIDEVKDEVEEVAEGVVGDKPSPEAVKSSPAVLDSHVTTHEIHMLTALVSRPFTWRSVSGLRREMGMARATAEGILERLVAKELADRKASRNGGFLYRITAGGRDALGLAPLLHGPTGGADDKGD